MKKIVLGILANVDAGKTTLTEAILYATGYLRKMGRVDHKDAFLDNFAMERARGITIFSKQAVFPLQKNDIEITLLDTPGHVDFSAETERTLQVLDYGVIVISGTDGVQAHTMTLWKLLKQYGIPVFLFVNKMDQPDTDRHKLMQELKKRLDDTCIDFTQEEEPSDDFLEEIAMCDEEVLEGYMEEGSIDKSSIQKLVKQRRLYPVFFGSALKLQGVEEFLDGMAEYITPNYYSKEFGAKVYKISRDEKGSRLTHLKVTGGNLPVKQSFGEYGKADQIRIYSGKKYELADQVQAGTICALSGLSGTYVGQGFGIENASYDPQLTPLLTYRVNLPEGTDLHKALEQLKQLEEEEPQLHIVWNSYLEEIQAQFMGEVQTEVLSALISERFHMDVTFDSGKIVYKETIENEVTGIGHYEPLRHFAHVNLILKPGKRGSGILFSSIAKEDDLDRNWQRLILTHLQEKEHIGVLAGMPITDIEIVLHSGKAHQKHTEGGDFRQATYRAVRQGLRKARSILLEPWYAFRLELPAECVGRAMNDIQKMSGSFEAPIIEEEIAILTGTAPVSEMMDYQQEVWTYSAGRGRLQVNLSGYEPCHNEEEVLAGMTYDPDQDLDNSADSVYCAHGAGYLVSWEEVDEKSGFKLETKEEFNLAELESKAQQAKKRQSQSLVEDKEFLAIYEREFGTLEQRRERYLQHNQSGARSISWGENQSKTSSTEKASLQKSENYSNKTYKKKKQYLLVDGYNIIFAWEELKKLAEVDMGAARGKLLDIMSNYQGFVGCTLIVVFDAYRVKNNPGSIYKHHSLYVVFTKEAETADQYIEKTTHEIGKKHDVMVATSDRVEQVIVMGQGGHRISASDFLKEVERVNTLIREENQKKKENGANYLFNYLSEEDAEELEKIRLGDQQ